MATRPQKGDQVTCRHAVEAYYSGYSGNPRWWFRPGMIGVVAAVAPKVVRKHDYDNDPRYDQAEEFLVVDYQDGVVQRRVSLNFCNARRVTKGIHAQHPDPLLPPAGATQRAGVGGNHRRRPRRR